MFYWRGGYNGWNALPMFLGMLLFLILVAVAVYLIVSVLHDRHHHGGTAAVPPNEAKGILDRRFAQGDISKEEYLERLELLGFTRKT